VYSVSSSLLRQLGINSTQQFTLYNLSPALLASLGGSNTQDLINQLISSGGINAAGSTALSALLGQLSSQSNSILSQPLTTFGGGITFFGLTLGTVTGNINLNESDVRTLQEATLRASQNTPATMKIGERVPIINATFAPIYNTASIASVLGNGSYIATFPSFNY
jgi:hypothetical protein